jgi:hypothetical protein
MDGQLTFAISSYVLALAMLVAEWRRTPWAGLAFIAAMVVGICLEIFNMRSWHDYYYDPFFFPVMIGEGGTAFPLTIACNWAVIIAFTLRICARLSTPWFLVPFICAALAVFLDMFLDPLSATSKIVAARGDACLSDALPAGDAIGIGFWVWCVSPHDSQLHLGIPLDNFIGWFLIVGPFLLLREAARRYLGAEARPLLQQALILVGVVVATLIVYPPLQNLSLLLERIGLAPWYTLGGWLAIGVVGLVLAGTKREPAPHDHWVTGLTIAYVLSAIVAYYTRGIADRADTHFFVVELVTMVAFVATVVWTRYGLPQRA